MLVPPGSVGVLGGVRGGLQGLEGDNIGLGGSVTLIVESAIMQS